MAPDPALRPSPLTFWAYLDAANDRILSHDPHADADASELLMMLNRASETIVRDLESGALRAHGLTWSQFRILHSLWLSGALEPREVAEVTGMSRALVSSTVKLLVASGLVESTSAAHDGRMRHVSLTPRGLDTIAAAYRAQNAQETEWVTSLSDAERAILLMLLRKLARGDASS